VKEGHLIRGEPITFSVADHLAYRRKRRERGGEEGKGKESERI
jgi:hypothetical protein